MTTQDPCPRTHGPTVLIAEKDGAVRGALAHRLRADGFDVLEARSSVEALLVASEFQGSIGAFVTSPGIRKFCNGPELASCLRLTYPGIEVFYLGDPCDIGEEVARELARGEAVRIRKPLAGDAIDRIVSLLEERLAQPASQPAWKAAGSWN